MIIQSRRWALPIASGIAATIGGAIAAVHYHRLGLTLSHYDARGHLVVARRIVDSITPGWQQIGAVWLPLPHLLNAIPVHIDLFYRTGASAVAISVASFAAATVAIAWIVRAQTESAAGTVTAALAFALNPNVLYLQATPMTEPLLMALTTVAVAMLIEWCRSGRARGTPTGWMFALACLTRYEAWPVTFSALAGAIFVRRRRGATWTEAVRSAWSIAVIPALAIVAFLVFSRVVIGEWLARDFFVPENKALGEPMVAAAEIWWGTHQLSGTTISLVAALSAVVLACAALLSMVSVDGLLVLSLLTTAVVPWSAFVDGHPFRIRYMVPLIASEAIGIGVAVGYLSRAPGLRGSFALMSRVLAALVAVTVLIEIRPLDMSAPMIVEAQWDRPNVPVRKQVTDCLRASYDGDKIMASMGSLGHYMQESSRDGFAIRDFLHEGNGDIWLAALDWPRPFVGWVLIEEKAEGGDMLAKTARERPQFLDGFERVCEGAGLALYRRSPSEPDDQNEDKSRRMGQPEGRSLPAPFLTAR